ncbi:MAG: hypothetical protein RMK30_10110, partial [Anaerolineae bacterium]|nr:hypothetical protein [Anaerolineae bacterium]
MWEWGQWEGQAWEVLRERGDAEAFLEIGDTQKQNMGHTTSGTHGKLSGRPSVPINEALRFY